MTLIQNPEVNRPTPDGFKSQLLDHATVADVTRFGLRNNEGMWPSYNWIDTAVQTPTCESPLSDPDASPFKVFVKGQWVPAAEFAVYSGVQCSAVGLDKDDMVSELRRVAEVTESRGVERWLAANQFYGSNDFLPSITDITPGELSMAVAFAELEGYVGSIYAGQPTIHMSRSVASLLGADKIVFDGDKAYSRLGSKIVIGTGYGPEDGGSWSMFGTGEVYVERSETVDVNTWVLPGDGSGTGTEQNGLADNTVVALVERMFRVAFDGPMYKISGKAF